MNDEKVIRTVKSIYDIRQTEIFDFFTTEVSNIDWWRVFSRSVWTNTVSLCRNGKRKHRRNRRKSSIGINMSDTQQLDTGKMAEQHLPFFFCLVGRWIFSLSPLFSNPQNQLPM